MTEQELRNSPDWDIIELKFNVDVEKLKDWYYTVEKNFPHLKFNLRMSHLFREDKIPTDDTVLSMYNIKDLSYGLHSFGMSWPVETELPIPPKFACKEDLYPEAYDPNFEQKLQIMSRYKFGYFNELLEALGEDTLAWARITVHDAGSAIENHTDGRNTIRLHIPIITTDQTFFCWGENKERRYVFKPGSIYLINTGIVHSTSNQGLDTRAHIISHPTNVDWLLNNLC